MSLGPPFDASGLRLQRWVGAGVVLLLLGAVAWVLFLSGRTLGRGVILRLSMRMAGPLHAGARVRIAGRDVGEIRSERWEKDGVSFDAFVAQKWVEHVHVNSELFVATPSVLGEAYLEIGPPEGGAPPGAVVRDGESLHVADPPDLDRFFVHGEASLREVLALLRDERPGLNELLAAGDSLLATLSGLPTSPGQLRRIVDQGAAALDAGRELFASLRDANAVARVRQIVADLSAIADSVGPELRDLGDRLDLALTRADQLRTLFTDERRAQASAALASLRRAAKLGAQIADDVEFLDKRVRSGQGTLGAFLQDRELFDDLHETHRIIKSQPLRFLLKTLKPKEKIVP